MDINQQYAKGVPNKNGRNLPTDARSAYRQLPKLAFGALLASHSYAV